MNIQEKVTNQIKEAMKSKDKVALEALRAAKTAFTLAKTEKGGGDDISSEEELKIIQKLVKQRNDSADIYKQQNRPELAEKEVAEAAVLEKFLPAKMSEEELEQELVKIIEQVGASAPSDMGKVMGVATKQLAGRADGKAISTKVRELLNK
ncbi:MAG: GatB/YqeY domain-containing protein [Bacteroidales bacterium]|nr:GatB/YqeY domain-containing protein [Bacteroidales bacterium]